MCACLQCNTLLLDSLPEIVIPGIISFTEGSRRSKVDAQEKIPKIICSPVRQLPTSVGFSLVSQETPDSFGWRATVQGTQASLFPEGELLYKRSGSTGMSTFI